MEDKNKGNDNYRSLYMHKHDIFPMLLSDLGDNARIIEVKKSSSFKKTLVMLDDKEQFCSIIFDFHGNVILRNTRWESFFNKNDIHTIIKYAFRHSSLIIASSCCIGSALHNIRNYQHHMPNNSFFIGIGSSKSSTYNAISNRIASCFSKNSQSEPNPLKVIASVAYEHPTETLSIAHKNTEGKMVYFKIRGLKKSKNKLDDNSLKFDQLFDHFATHVVTEIWDNNLFGRSPFTDSKLPEFEKVRDEVSKYIREKKPKKLEEWSHHYCLKRMTNSIIHKDYSSFHYYDQLLEKNNIIRTLEDNYLYHQHPFYWLIYFKNRELTKSFLASESFNKSALYDFIDHLSDKSEDLLFLTSCIDDINKKNSKEETLLHKLAVTISPKLLFSFLEQQKEIKIDESDSSGATALHCAIKRMKTPIVELLLQRGASPHSQDNCGYSILADALRYSNDEHITRVALVLRYGANPNQLIPVQTGKEGNEIIENFSCFTYAVNRSSSKLSYLLLEHGASWVGCCQIDAFSKEKKDNFYNTLAIALAAYWIRAAIPKKWHSFPDESIVNREQAQASLANELQKKIEASTTFLPFLWENREELKKLLQQEFCVQKKKESHSRLVMDIDKMLKIVNQDQLIVNNEERLSISL